jgi:hypothetical protein
MNISRLGLYLQTFGCRALEERADMVTETRGR